MHRLGSFLLIMLVTLLVPALLRAEPDCPDRKNCDSPWCRNRQGDCDRRMRECYGARQPVKSPEQARKAIEEYLADRKDVVIGKIEERRWGYQAEIRDRNDKVVDRVMVHRRTGRVRSIY